MTTSNVMVTTEPRVLELRNLSAGSYLLRIERNALSFIPGQNISLGLPRLHINREYSVCSGLNDPWFDLLIREIPDGALSPALRRCVPGDRLEMCGPYGSFVLERPADAARRYLFVCTGTGIAPYLSFVRSHPLSDYRILHGVHTPEDRLDAPAWGLAPDRYLACITQQAGAADFHGRVTDWLRAQTVAPGTVCYLCGNNRMLAEAYDLLRAQGVAAGDVITEAFF